MKSIVYSFRNKKPVFFELDRFYVIRNQAEADALIERLLDIDAVCMPVELNESLSYPVLLELESGFAPTLKFASEKDLEKMDGLLAQLKKTLRKARKKTKV